MFAFVIYDRQTQTLFGARDPFGIKPFYYLETGEFIYVASEAMKGIVPEHILHRPKLGFPVPLRHWLKEELFEWAWLLIKESKYDSIFQKSVH